MLAHRKTHPKASPMKASKHHPPPIKGGKASAPASNEALTPTLKYSIFVKHAKGLSEAALASYFRQWGTLVSVQQPPNTDYAYVTFASDESPLAVLAQGQCQVVEGRSVVVLPRFEPRKPYFAEKERKNEQLLDQLRQPDHVVPKTLRCVEAKRPAVLSLGQELAWSVDLENRGTQERVLYSVALVPTVPEFKVSCLIRSTGSIVCPGGSFTVKLHFKPREPYRFGILRCLLVLEGRNFVLSHPLRVEVSDPEELDLLKPSSEFIPKELAIDDVKRIIIPAFPATRASKSHLHTAVETNWVEALKDYPIDKEIQDDVSARGHSSNFDPWLTRDNYRPRLHNLLWVEEAQGVVNMQKFTLVEARLEPISSFMENQRAIEVDEVDNPICKLIIPGLAEGRPSVLASDIVYVWLPGTTDYEYEGIVHRVMQDHVLLTLCKDFHRMLAHNPQQPFNVRFGFNRMGHRLMHRAVDKADIKLVWPEPKAVLGEVDKGTVAAAAAPQLGQMIQWFDQMIAQNEEQAQAVKGIVNKRYGTNTAPLLLFGAFGTGKTRTLLEAIKQIIRLHPADTKILICAPSNSAADVFAEHLADFPLLSGDTLFRHNAFHRSSASVPPSVFQFTWHDAEAGVFNIPPIRALLSYKVIVSTAYTAGNLFGVGVPKNHFTHIILDEAAQMMEAEALIPLTLADERSVIIMAGDYHQLGPHLVSKSSKLHGLNKSIMERMANLPIYSLHRGLCVELVKNYRSHPALLAYPSAHFYQDKLVALADPKAVNTLCGWKSLPNPKFPLLFYGVEGQDLQEGDSPSFFNPHEAVVVADLVDKLIRDKRLSEHDVGVISPFRKQNMKIRQLLRKRGFYNVRVDSVNEMQGKERKAIFMSTVRSSRDWQDHDRLHGIGFLNDPRRLNTAITRAQALLVVVGDPYVLYQDSHWKDLIQYCHANNSYIGPELRVDYFDSREKKEQRHTAAQQQRQQQLQPQSAPAPHQQKPPSPPHPQELKTPQPQPPLTHPPQTQTTTAATPKIHPPQAAKAPNPWFDSHAVVAATTTQGQPQGGTLHTGPIHQLQSQRTTPTAAPQQQQPPAWQPLTSSSLPPLLPQHPTSLGNGRQPPPVGSVAMPQAQHHALRGNGMRISADVKPSPHARPFHPQSAAPVDGASSPSPSNVAATQLVEENERLAKQMAIPQPLPSHPFITPAGDDAVDEEDDGTMDDEFAPVFVFEGSPVLLVKKTSAAYPAVMAFERKEDACLVVQISIFGLRACVKRRGGLIYVSLSEPPENTRSVRFALTSLHPMPPPPPASQGKEKKKKGGREGERSRLIVAVPQDTFDDTKTRFEQGETLLIVTMTRRTSSALPRSSHATEPVCV